MCAQASPAAMPCWTLSGVTIVVLFPYAVP
jgi:hypothetical protein